ncbi:hypothetical protein QUB63_23470 [Microcoleus sp. ARI1-B5]|uniref:hypothetical protein n=1 Tax=unclassified Microcoleus TaxID=2642155 RepID=UPI002FCF31A5
MSVDQITCALISYIATRNIDFTFLETADEQSLLIGDRIDRTCEKFDRQFLLNKQPLHPTL